jgi:uncharacterized MAPEG superfamily protein
MTIPVWVLLAFAGWTLFVLIAHIGTYRWARILTGKAKFHHFPADRVEGPDFYRRSMRAHLNCIENLPIYGAVVLAIVVAHLQAPLLDNLALVLLGARILQSTLHLFFRETNVSVMLRSTFYTVQLVCMIWMGIFVVLHA